MDIFRKIINISSQTVSMRGRWKDPGPCKSPTVHKSSEKHKQPVISLPAAVNHNKLWQPIRGQDCGSAQVTFKMVKGRGQRMFCVCVYYYTNSDLPSLIQSLWATQQFKGSSHCCLRAGPSNLQGGRWLVSVGVCMPPQPPIPPAPHPTDLRYKGVDNRGS